jgi:hypothetical protein
MAGSRPERRISFLPLRGDLMAMAVGPRPDAAVSLSRKPDSPRSIDIPEDPLWISIAPAALRNFEKLPAGTRSFARAMQGADQVRLSLSAAAGGAFEARLLVQCPSDRDAAALRKHLEQTTEMLRKMIAREGQTPNPADLSGVLTGGVFRQQGARVEGRWPVQQAFVDSILGGGTD